MKDNSWLSTDLQSLKQNVGPLGYQFCLVTLSASEHFWTLLSVKGENTALVEIIDNFGYSKVSARWVPRMWQMHTKRQGSNTTDSYSALIPHRSWGLPVANCYAIYKLDSPSRTRSYAPVDGMASHDLLGEEIQESAPQQKKSWLQTYVGFLPRGDNSEIWRL